MRPLEEILEASSEALPNMSHEDRLCGSSISHIHTTTHHTTNTSTSHHTEPTHTPLHRPTSVFQRTNRPSPAHTAEDSTETNVL